MVIPVSPQIAKLYIPEDPRSLPRAAMTRLDFRGASAYLKEQQQLLIGLKARRAGLVTCLIPVGTVFALTIVEKRPLQCTV
jgi:hypothetical protein